ncbi:helix-turn-helix transcriptional regulator [Draconibacterium orientale]|uniref:response regulator transcription factor n=1 Tax=Draconibacterium orientale TaxID=1168034 RepID=UPI0029C0D345|nr:helix-turn-helix transcriptional regulator [Draconibacterium orientale]
MNKTQANFFDPIEQTKYIGHENYVKIEHYINALKSISKLIDLSFYVVDYYKKGFYYVSSNDLFLSGYSQEEVLDLGFDFYPRTVSQEDLNLLFELNDAAFRFFYDLEVSRRDKATISYDFKLKHKNSHRMVMINHKLTPLLLTEGGNIWMSICLVTLSSSEKSGDVHIIMQDDSSRYDLNKRCLQFIKTQPKKLTPKETEIIKLIALGYRTEKVAAILKVSESTVKNHKTQIFKKLHAKTSAEAVFYASKRGLI